MNGHINESAITGVEPLPQSVIDEAKVVSLEEEDGQWGGIVAWPDPTFHERYVLVALIDGRWMTVARGWKGIFVRPAPMWLPRPCPAADWIVEKLVKELEERQR